MKKSAEIIFAFILILSSSCNSTLSTDGNPKEVLIKFLSALVKRDVTTARQLATQDSQGMFNLMEMGMRMVPDSVQNKSFDRKMEFGSATINGDNATVPVKDKESGESTIFNLKKESGGWKVAFDISTMMQMGQNKMREKGMTEQQMNEMMNKMKGVLETNPGLKKIMGDTAK